MTTVAALQDPCVIYQRIQEYKRVMSYYTEEINKLMSFCPMPGFRFDIKTGELEQLPIDKKWQHALDNAVGVANEILKSDFPEFYKEQR